MTDDETTQPKDDENEPERLIQPHAGPPEPPDGHDLEDEGKERRRFMAPRDTRLLLQKNGRVGRLKKKGPMYHGIDDGAYSPTGAARFWNPHWIPPGWLTVYPEGDPDPVGEAHPKGWNAVLTGKTVGDYVLHVFTGGLRGGRRFAGIPVQVLLMVAAVLIVAGLVGFVLWRRSQLGA